MVFRRTVKLMGASLFMGMSALAGAIVYVNLYEKITGKSIDEK